MATPICHLCGFSFRECRCAIDGTMPPPPLPPMPPEVKRLVEAAIDARAKIAPGCLAFEIDDAVAAVRRIFRSEP